LSEFSLIFLPFVKIPFMKQLQFFFYAIILLASCKTEEKPVTLEQAAQFAGSIEKSVANKDESFFNKSFDLDALMAKMKAAAPNESGSFWQGVKRGMGEKMNFGTKVIQATGSKGFYALVKQYQKGDKQHLLFRLFSDGAINYHDFELVNKKDNIKIADAYIYTTGELFSKTLKDIFAEVLKSDAASLSALSNFSKLNKLIQNKDYKKAKAMMDALPENLKNTKVIQLRNIEVCLEIDTALYTQAIDKFKHDFPADPSLNLVLLDGLIINGKYAAALTTVNQLDSQINKDPMLDYYRGLLSNLQGNKAVALQAFERLYKNMPKFSPGAMELCTYYMDEGNYKQAADIIKKAKSNRDFDKSVVENLQALYPKLKKYSEE
jgi:tetratricopeptide (TPR) repeat protein